MLNTLQTGEPVRPHTVRDALNALISVCDMAETRDDAGFNATDAPSAHNLSYFPVWTQRQQQFVREMLRKYKTQLSRTFGIDYDTLADERVRDPNRDPPTVREMLGALLHAKQIDHLDYDVAMSLVKQRPWSQKQQKIARETLAGYRDLLDRFQFTYTDVIDEDTVPDPTPSESGTVRGALKILHHHNKLADHDQPTAKSLLSFKLWSAKQQGFAHAIVQRYWRQLLMYWNIDAENLRYEEVKENLPEPDSVLAYDRKERIFTLSTQKKWRTVAKGVPGSHWNPQQYVWEYPDNQKTAVALEEMIQEHGDECKIVLDETAEQRLGELLFDLEEERRQRDLVTNIKTIDVSHIELPIRNATPFDHQRRAFAIATALDASAFLMEQGTGKTLAAVATIGYRYLTGQVHRVFVVAPLSVVYNWKKELEKFLDAPVNVVVVDGKTNEERKRKFADATRIDTLNVCTVNYDAISPREMKRKDGEGKVVEVYQTGGLVDEIRAWNPDMVILDESQRIKNRKAKRAEFLHRLGDMVRYKLILTGTPVTQNPLDIWSQYRFLNRNIFGDSYYVFENRYAKIKEIVVGGRRVRIVDGYQNLNDLIEKAHSIAYRVTKADALDLPECVDQTLYCDLNPTARKIYKKMHDDALVQIEQVLGQDLKNMDQRLLLLNLLIGDEITQPDEAKAVLGDEFMSANNLAIRNKLHGKIKATSVLTGLLRSSQITGGFIPVLKKDGATEIKQISDDKMQVLKEFMEDLPDGKKVVIFCRFLPEIDAIVTMLNEMEIPAASITGATSGQARSDLIDAFQEMEEPRVLVIQTQTGGLGITLTRADTAIFYSYSYSFADYEQARARIHRIGQTNKVTYIHIVARNTVDEAVIDALHFKKRLADIVVDQQRDQAEEGWLDAPAPPADVQAEL